MTKIVDSFLFFNELDLLELRLNILNDYVDYFVITEADQTFSGNVKEFLYRENAERFSKFADKIVYNPVNIPNNFSVTWDREIYQRNSPISELVKLFSDDDLILTSDIDEIPSTEVLRKYKSWFKCDELFHFKQNMYMYYINNFKTDQWFGTRACSLSYLKSKTIDDIRQATEDEFKLSGNIIENAGWHFSYLGGADQIKYKIESFSHQEYNNDYVKSNIKQFLESNNDVLGRNCNHQIVDIDDSYPDFIINNLEHLSKFILQ
jgi:beta-1,4-mannosyl-glycoprotein beta-1,4-N-acetylglucosaminyltransferase